MYKETLQALGEGLQEPVYIKKAILENQLKYHFANKNEENESIHNDSVAIVRRVVNMLNINELIGFQPLSLEDPKIMSSGVEYDAIIPVTRPFRAGWSMEAMEDMKTLHGIDIHFELITAMSTEIENEITSEIIRKIDQVAGHAGTVEADFSGTDILEQAAMIKQTIISNVREVDGNWIIISPFIVSMLQSCNDSEYKQTESSTWNKSSLTYMGTLDENIKVYSNMFLIDDNTVLIGSKVEDREDTPIVYAPETLLMPNSREIPEGFGTMWGFNTRYSLFTEPVSADAIYRKLSIKT